MQLLRELTGFIIRSGHCVNLFLLLPMYNSSRPITLASQNSTVQCECCAIYYCERAIETFLEIQYNNLFVGV